jgi:hypothetical protein
MPTPAPSGWKCGSMSDNAGAVYAALVDEQLQEENRRKASFEARGLAVITTSAALVSLLFGLTGVVTQSDSFELGGTPRSFLILSAALFVAAAVLGLSSNWPLKYQQVEIDNLRQLTSEQYWDGEGSVARRRVAEVRVNILARSRSLNLLKGKLLLAAILVEVLAVLALAISAVAIVATG